MEHEQSGFEQKAAALEALVQAMEQGGMSLEEMLASYEQGVRMVKDLTGQLESARQRLLVLRQGVLTEPETPEEPA